MGDFNGYREMTLDEILNDESIEAVAVECEEIYLTKYALLAAKHGKHIHMEKPGGLCLEDFEDLVKTQKENKKILHIGYMYRYNPIIIKLLSDIENGDFGKIFSIETTMSCWHPKEMRKWLEVFPGGMTFFLGCHLIDLILQIQGLPKRVVPLNAGTSLDGNSSKDIGMVALEYENGVSFAKTSACERGGFVRREFVVCGEKKTLEIKPIELHVGDKHATEATGYVDTGWQIDGKKIKSELFDRYDPMMRAFAEFLRGERPVKLGYDYELALYKILLLACKDGITEL